MVANEIKMKIVAITGASAGLGKAIALKFAKKGFACGLISRNQERLEGLKKEIEALGGKACIAIADVAFYEQMEKAIALIEQELGLIDIWINNAMASIFSPFHEITAEEFKRVTEVTYLGTVHGTMVALKTMRKRNHGMILHVGSALAYRGIPLQAPYCGAKHAIKGFTESLYCELLHEKSAIKLSMIEMPAINTPQFNWVRSRLARKAQPVPPIFQPEVAADAVYWAALHYRREWILGFSAQKAITMNKFFPTLISHYLVKKGFDAQQYDGHEDPNREDNLFASVDGNFGSHGDFDDRAKSFCLQFWISKLRVLIGISLLILVCIWLRFKIMQ